MLNRNLLLFSNSIKENCLNVLKFKRAKRTTNITILVIRFSIASVWQFREYIAVRSTINEPYYEEKKIARISAILLFDQTEISGTQSNKD